MSIPDSLKLNTFKQAFSATISPESYYENEMIFLKNIIHSLFNYDGLDDDEILYLENILYYGTGFAFVTNDKKVYNATPIDWGRTGKPVKFNLMDYHGTIPGEFTDGVDGVFLYNRKPAHVNENTNMVHLLNSYASQLTNIDISIMVAMFNSRLTKMFVSNDSVATAAIMQAVNDSILGKTAVIDNKKLTAFYGTDFMKEFNDGHNIQYIPDLLDSRKQILNNFYETLGIPTLPDKKERVITAETFDSSVTLNSNTYIFERKKLEKIGITVTLNLQGGELDEQTDSISISESEVQS